MKILKRGLVAVLVLVLAYVLAAFVIGRVIVSETERFSEALALQDGVTVHRLDYEAGLFGGVLRYDIDYVPPADSFLGALAWPGLSHSRGEMVVRHGPWVGDGVALAVGEGRAEVPSEMRSVLPGLMPEKALVDMEMRHRLDRSVRVSFVGLEHEGALVAQGTFDTVGTVKLAGVRGWSEFDASLSWLDYDFGVAASLVDVTEPAADAVRLEMNGLSSRGALSRVGGEWAGTLEVALEGADARTTEVTARAEELAVQLLLGVHETQQGPRRSLGMQSTLASLHVEEQGDDSWSLSLGGTRANAEMVEDWPQLWGGTSELHITEVAAVDQGLRVQTEYVTLNSVTERKDDVFDQTLAVRVGPVQWGDSQLGGGRLVTSLKGINGLALSQMLDVISRSTYNPPEASENDVELAMQQAALVIFAGTPSMALDHVGLSVLQEDDIRGQLVFSLAEGDESMAGAGLMGALMRVQVEGSLTARLDAVNELLRLMAKAELRGVDGIDAEAAQQVGDERFAEWLVLMEESPYVTVDGDSVSTEIAYLEDELSINGEALDPMMLLLLLAVLGER